MFNKLLFLLLVVCATANAGAPQSRILVFGDSLSAAYGIPVEQGWVELLDQRLRAQGYPYEVINKSLSGETTAGGLQRLPGLLDELSPDIVVLELGANDGLRGLSLAQMRANLVAIIERSRDSGSRILLLGMRIPPNYGERYSAAFARTFSDLAQQYDVAFVPFFLESIALRLSAFQEDGIHPSAEAQTDLLDTVWPAVKSLLIEAPAD